ncbi:hypothetical protein Poli38472_012711 [Pythium oligandrum]|uniref:WW domain-containing protein n=1 Tax=Pythium oligandrum TaxID=41045 RepID=A0A8K1CEU7_PYTOL|nr:hypothetical protein Poli38472_012711 [Pythium oligandrum]|eukprot:TMW61520.1 hypothetical protein Poli38472_012711 [Pythium oligandrum]
MSTWEEAFDEASGRVYYFSRLTGATSWDPPPEESNDDSNAWQEVFDEASQTTYYYNIQTGETSWTRPAAAPSIEDLSYLAFTVVRLQSLFRGQRERRRLSRIVRAQYQITQDVVTQQTLYTNLRSNSSSWTRPALFSRLGIDDQDDGDDNDDDDEDFEAFQREAEEDEDEAGDDDDNNDANGEDDEDPSLLKKKKRKQPRSKAQQRVDDAEDLGDQVLELDMSGLRAWRLSSRIWNLTTLMRLTLANNELARIPSGIQDLVQLEWLDISHNQLTRLPSCLHTTTTLTYLDASHNQIATFSPKLWKLRALTHLNLSWNALEELPYIEGDLKLLRDTREWQVGVGLLTVLRFLDVSHNRLTVVPKSIERCVALIQCRLSNNRLHVLSDELCELGTALEELYLESNSLTTLPENIGNLSTLRILDLNQNRLTAIPDTLGNLQELTDMRLAHNQITRIPEECGAMGKLERIILDGNPHLATLAACFRLLPSVSSLSASQCGVVSFDTVDFLIKAPVERLILSQNTLIAFPLALQRSVMRGTIRELVLSHNKLLGFPKEIVMPEPCKVLRVLDLSHNQLTSIPAAIARLSRLETLVLSHNNLKRDDALPESLAQLTSLRELRCDHNSLSRLPLGMGFLSRLEHLDVSFNNLSVLPSSMMDIASSLKSLRVNDNALTSRPSISIFLASTCIVDFSNNPFCGDVGSINSGFVEKATASATSLFNAREYKDAEKTLDPSIQAMLSKQDHPIRYQVVRDHLPQQLLLRGLSRFLMLKHEKGMADEASEEIRQYEQDLHGEALVEKRKKRHKDRLNTQKKLEQQAHKEPEQPEDNSSEPFVPANNQKEDIVESESHTVLRRKLDDVAVLRIKARDMMTRHSEGALSDLQQAIALRTTEQVTAYYVLGMLQMMRCEYDEAVRSLTQALQRVATCISPKKPGDEVEWTHVPRSSIPILMCRAEAYRRLGQLPLALNDVRLVLKHHMVEAEDVCATEQALAFEWDTQQTQYFVDNEEFFRAFDVAPKSGLLRRPEVVDLHTIRSAEEQKELRTMTPAQRFQANVDRLTHEFQQKRQAATKVLQDKYSQREQTLQRTRDFKREIRENLRMELEEATQRAVEAELERLAELRRQEREREFQEMMYMKYEDDYMQWLVGEEARLEAERLRLEEAARRKAEARAQYETRLARRGGRRQQQAPGRGTPGRNKSPTSSTRSRSPSPVARGKQPS